MKRTRWLLTTIVCLILCVIGGAAIADSPNLDSGIRLDAVATYVPGENTPLTVAICDANDVMGDWKTNQHWSLTLSDPWGDTVFWRIEGEENAPNVLYTVPSNVVLSPGQIYKFRFEMDLQEYDLVDDEAYFVVMEEPAETQPNLDISIGQAGMDNYSSSAQQEKTANILYSVRIQKDDSITAVKVMNRDHWEYICGDDSYEREWRWEAGESVLMAFGTTEQIDPEAPGFEWENLNWNVSSNVISLIVKAEQGRLAKPTLTVEGAYSYTRGDMLTVTLSKVTGGVWYYVRVFKTNNG